MLDDTDYFDYEWHEVPKVMYYALATGLAVLLVWAPFSFTELPGVWVVWYVGLFFLGVSVVFALLTFPMYYLDGKKINEASGSTGTRTSSSTSLRASS